MVKRYLVFNIGCIECGVSSNVVGTYGTIEEAEKVRDLLDAELRWRQNGQNNFEVFDLHAPQAQEYADALSGALAESNKTR